mgnify:FL=1
MLFRSPQPKGSARQGGESRDRSTQTFSKRKGKAFAKQKLYRALFLPESQRQKESKRCGSDLRNGKKRMRGCGNRLDRTAMHTARIPYCERRKTVRRIGGYGRSETGRKGSACLYAGKDAVPKAQPQRRGKQRNWF